MRPFVKLADPQDYIACPWNLSVDGEGRGYWVEFFKRHINTILKLGVEAAIARHEPGESATRRADACRAEFYEVFDRFAAEPLLYGTVTIVTLDKWRDQILRNQ